MVFVGCMTRFLRTCFLGRQERRAWAPFTRALRKADAAVRDRCSRGKSPGD